MLLDSEGTSGVLIGVLDADASFLSGSGNIDTYHNTVL
jgi:hypothetical protein